MKNASEEELEKRGKGGGTDEGLDGRRRTKGGEVTHQQVRVGGTEGGEWVVGGFSGGIIC